MGRKSRVAKLSVSFLYGASESLEHVPAALIRGRWLLGVALTPLGTPPLRLGSMVESRGGRGAFRVLWVSRRFRSGPQSGSLESVSRPLLVKPDMQNYRIRLSDRIMSSPTEGP